MTPRSSAAVGSRATAPHRVVHLSTAERVAIGKEARASVPRATQGQWSPSKGRPDPIALLESQAASRVPELVPIRYGRMLTSPFAFYRGAALLMASDLSDSASSGLHVQACGDAHLSNFGVFASAERNLVFDLNDFDETLPGPWEWDVKRLVASFEVGGREQGFSEADRAKIIAGTSEAYRTQMALFAAMPDLEVWYARLDIERVLAEVGPELGVATGKKSDKEMAKLRTRASKQLVKARTRDSMQAASKLTKVVNGALEFVSDPPLLVPIEELQSEEQSRDFTNRLGELVRSYRSTLQSDRQHLLEQFQVRRIARKVVGVGSVGTRAWVVLLVGSDGQTPLLLQAKEAQTSVLARYVGDSLYTNQGERVVAGQHLMQASSDIFLGFEHLTGMDGVERDFYFRQLRDWKGSADTSLMSPLAMATYGRLCGWTLARAHARSGDRVAIASYLGGGRQFDEAMVAFSSAYADQNQRDFDALQEAVSAGRIVAQSGL